VPVSSWWREEAEEEMIERGGNVGGRTTALDEHELRGVGGGGCALPVDERRRRGRGGETMVRS